MELPSLYLESTIVSYYTNPFSDRLTPHTRQMKTHEWWNTDRKNYQIYISQIVIDEATIGDSKECEKRLQVIKPFPVLQLNQKIVDLAKMYYHFLSFPTKEGKGMKDALHLAVAVFHQIPLVITPEQLLEKGEDI